MKRQIVFVIASIAILLSFGITLKEDLNLRSWLDKVVPDDVRFLKDTDRDGLLDSKDNCPTISNAGQIDRDFDGKGDFCDDLNGIGNGTFPKGSYETGSIPKMAIFDDFNKDGNLDAAVINQGSNDVSILLGNGDGRFEAQTTFATGSEPSAVATEDMNRDGNLDIVTTNKGSNDITLLLGDSFGGFTNSGSYNVGGTPLSIALGDLNEDDFVDVVTADSSSDTVSVLISRSGVFDSAVSYITGDTPVSIALGDLNDDGSLDIVTANKISNDISVFLNEGDGIFPGGARFGVDNGPASVALGDLEQDGDLDIVTANSGSRTLTNLRGNNTGTFQRVYDQSVSGYADFIILADQDKDGALDAFTGGYVSFSSSLTRLLGSLGSIIWHTPISIYDLGAGITSVAAGDLDSRTESNGNIDLGVVNSTADKITPLIYDQNSGKNQPIAGPRYSIGEDAESIATGDLDHDGDLDVVAITSYSRDGMEVFLWDSVNSKFNAAGRYITDELDLVFVALGDFNSDHHLDAVTSDLGADEIILFQGDGKGNFQMKNSYPTGGDYNHRLALGDIDKDGNLDVVTTNLRSDNVSVFLGNGDLTFESPSLFSIGEGGVNPVSILLVDVNKDSFLDILTGNSGSINISILLGTGSPTDLFNSPMIVSSEKPLETIEVGDFDGDGGNFLDIVMTQPADDSVSILFNGDFGQAREFKVGDDPDDVAIGDVNGDGLLDILTTNAGSNDVSVLLGLGEGEFKDPVRYDVGKEPMRIILGDVNHDGALDILSLNGESNDFSLLLGNK
ncbi:MAG: VCBS repeat-containing protein [Deltaproteobacteria bacterium]|nr:VCBS repeat-containing protein [Deltaproteobacteria bacterium]